MRTASMIIATVLVFGVALVLSDVLVRFVLELAAGGEASSLLWVRYLSDPLIAAAAAGGWVWLIARPRSAARRR